MSIQEFQKYLEKYQFRQQQCLYPLLFQEYIYVFAYDYGFNASSQPVKKLIGYDNQSSLILVKRLIIRAYQPTFLMSSVKNCNQNQFNEHNQFFYSHFFSQIISESFGIVVEIPFFLQFLFPSKKKIPKLQNLRSIHSIFSFLEDKLSYLNYVSDILIPYPIHFQILIQILQCWIQDIPSLHLLRFFLFDYSRWSNENKSISKKLVSIFSKENKRLSRFLYNSYISEYEFSFLFIRKQSSCLRLTSSGTFLERIYFYRKIEHFIIVHNTFFQKTLWFFRDPFMHYVRYQGKAILASKGTLLFMKKWKSYLVFFWQYYFHFWSNSNRFHINQFSYYSLYFLGYFSSVKRNHCVVRSQILEDSVSIDTIINKLDTIVPTIPLIRSLSKAAFCTVLGHPISKSTWADLSDYYIINRFGQIFKNIFHFYSGSSKKRILYRIKYILRLSCAKTLARKHKSTIRTFLQKLGSIFFEEFFTEEEQVLSLVFQNTIHFSLHRSNKERIWYFDITYINDLISYET
uniref:maturase K n=1 Tax=Gahnia tristis TaxID=388572 RepID=UPI001F13B96F|nr:maturase K [Gahnia tristis]ULQ65998.1 maturase K [Gahnia tristis]